MAEDASPGIMVTGYVIKKELVQQIRRRPVVFLIICRKFVKV